MKTKTIVLLIITAIYVVAPACKKGMDVPSDCLSDAPLIRVINNQEVNIKLLSGRYYMIEKNAIDVRLSPCNLPVKFQADNLVVTVSGEVRGTVFVDACCTYGFVISKIKK